MSISATIEGRVGRVDDREAGGQTLREISIATEHYDRRARERVTTWVRVTIWPSRDGQIKGPGAWAQKGYAIVARGELCPREHEGRTYYDLVDARVMVAHPVGRTDDAAPEPAAVSPAAYDDVPF